MVIKLNGKVDKFLLAGDKFMPEMHLTKPVFSYSACRLCTKIKERIQKFKERFVQVIFIEMNLGMWVDWVEK